MRFSPRGWTGGHSFCRVCITKNIKANGKKCPYCRGKIRSMAINHSLKSLIDDFIVERRSMETKPGTVLSREQRHAGTSGASRSALGDRGHGLQRGQGGQSTAVRGELTENSYRRDYKALCVRCRILENELEDAKGEDTEIVRRMHAVTLATKRMEKEVGLANARVAQAQKELELATMHLEEQQDKAEQLTERRAKTKAGTTLIRSTLEALVAEKEKARVLAEGLAGK